ncbi:MAG: NAD(P)H-hydrate epimerase, partial [Gammaproteobacteria bacterium]
MTALPLTLYHAAQVRELDRIAIEDYGIPGATLMERAGAAAFAVLRQHWSQAQRIVVLCGVGNNGGDGFVIARLAHEAGVTVTVVQLGDTGSLRGAALQAYHSLIAAGITPVRFTSDTLSGAEVIVDALLGTGLDRELSAEWRAAVAAINAAEVPVLAVDIPSGLDADTGRVWGAAVRATITISFIGLKQGMYTAAGLIHCGAIE